MVVEVVKVLLFPSPLPALSETFMAMYRDVMAASWNDFESIVVLDE
jgi:hypothetical protein